MLNNHGFDLWSESYDHSVKQAESANQYPFAGYTALMNTAYGTIMHAAPAKVLDLGFGTALLTAKLYAGGNTITGLDFSAKMLKIAAAKMPEAELLQWDFTRGLPPALDGRRFDFIVSTYALHHLTDDAKSGFVAALLDLLEPSGTLLIGDVCFPTREAHDGCKATCGEGWDESEHYFVFDALQEALAHRCRLAFHAFSFCAGIIEIRKPS